MTHESVLFLDSVGSAAPASARIDSVEYRFMEYVDGIAPLHKKERSARLESAIFLRLRSAPLNNCIEDRVTR